MRRNSQAKGVFCVEGQWDSDLRDSSTVRPILELLRTSSNIGFIYRTCSTQEEFAFCLRKWPQHMYDAFPILYIAAHGTPSSIHLGDYTCDLDVIAEVLN